ncbi:MAG: amidohydrolase family protein [Acidimicrobiia bacterium]
MAKVEIGSHVPFAIDADSPLVSHGLLPDPEPRPVRYTIISVDDHLVEPPDMFEGRLPAKYQADAPRVVELENGAEAWSFDGQLYLQIGLNAVAGRPREDWNMKPTRFDQIRPGCWQIKERIRDMDINGVWASANFPSQIAGFAGTVFARTKDPELGIATMRAWNDWLFEEWYSPFPERIIPMGITWLMDPELGAEEIRRNAARGFTAVTLPEQPHRLNLPSVFSGYWDPIIRACVETETVIALHVGSSGLLPSPDDAPKLEMAATMFPLQSAQTAAEWIWSGIPTRFPDVKVTLSEGGIGWVPMMLDRLEYMFQQSGYDRSVWADPDFSPAEILLRNFYFCSIDDPTTFAVRDRIGVDHIMVEADYPHADSSWPDTQDYVARMLRHVDNLEDIRKITHRNAAQVFRHPLPPHPVP